MKTYVFDASAVFGFLQKKPAANKVNELLKDAMRISQPITKPVQWKY
jgi:PIN domain nuclease of toxin-antitoxin system